MNIHLTRPNPQGGTDQVWAWRTEWGGYVTETNAVTKIAGVKTCRTPRTFDNELARVKRRGYQEVTD